MVLNTEEWVELDLAFRGMKSPLRAAPYSVIDKTSFLKAFQVVDCQRDLDLIKQRFTC